MGCGASTAGYGRRDDASSVPALGNEEARMHREIESLEYISDADTVDEPSSFKRAVQIAAKCVVARVAHGITDDVLQFEEGMRELEPVFSDDEFNFMREWVDEMLAILGGDPPEPIPDHYILGPRQSAKERMKTSSTSFRPMDSSRTVATRVSHGNTGIIHSQSPPPAPPVDNRGGQLAFPSPRHETTHPITSPATQSSSMLGATGDTFVLDSTSSNAPRVVDPNHSLPTYVAAQNKKPTSAAAAKYAKDSGPLPPIPASPGEAQQWSLAEAVTRSPSLGRKQTSAKIVSSPTQGGLPGDVVTE